MNGRLGGTAQRLTSGENATAHDLWRTPVKAPVRLRMRNREDVEKVAHLEQGRSRSDPPGSRVNLSCERHRDVCRRRRALRITETELKLIAAAANMGDSNQPVQG